MVRWIAACIMFVFVSTTALASVPQQINHQGVVSVSGVRFNGVGSFKFAIVDPGSGRNLWCNDDNDPADTSPDCAGKIGVVPATSCSLTVTDGVYSIRLGDSDLACMQAVPSSVFNVNNARLRIWFDDGVNDEQQLTPDQKLTSAPYAHTAAIGVPPGTMVAFAGAAEPDGWMSCDGRTVLRADFPDLFNAIGESWGAGDGTNTFNLPDLQGRFARGATGTQPLGTTGGNDMVNLSHLHGLNRHHHQLPPITGSPSFNGGAVVAFRRQTIPIPPAGQRYYIRDDNAGWISTTHLGTGGTAGSEGHHRHTLGGWTRELLTSEFDHPADEGALTKTSLSSATSIVPSNVHVNWIIKH